jgi:hypothetical protein
MNAGLGRVRRRGFAVTIAEDFNRSSLVARVKNILLKPAGTWAVIAVEPATAKGLYTGYAVILAAIPPVAGLIGGQVFGYGILGVTYRPPLIGAIVGAIFSYVLSLAAIYVLSLIIDALAPSFDGRKNHIQALKVAVYAYTAAWVAGIFSLVPALGALHFLGGLYSLYLLYLGLPTLMNAPRTKALGYTAVCVIVAIILSIVVGVVVGLLGLSSMGPLPHINAVGAANSLGAGASNDRGGSSAGTLNIGGASIDLDKLTAATRQMAAAGKQITNATDSGSAGAPGAAPVAAAPVVAVPVDVLKGYLPESVAGYARGDVTASAGGVAGMSGSSARAEYGAGDPHLTLTIVDLGGAAGFAAMAGALGVESDNETATGYDKVGTINGRLTSEEWDRQSKSGKYGVLVGNRFMIEASGNVAGIDDLKAAVDSVGPDKLERLAKN